MNAEETIDDYGVCILGEETAMIEWMLQLCIPVVSFTVFVIAVLGFS